MIRKLYLFALRTLIMAAMGTLAGADATAPYTLAYFSSDWLQPVDALVLPRLRALLADANAADTAHPTVGVLQVRRDDQPSSSDPGVQRLEPSYELNASRRFQRCVSCLLFPMYVTVVGFIFPSSMVAYDLLLYWTGQVLSELLHAERPPSAAWQTLQPLWQVNTSSSPTPGDLPTALNVDDPVLVQMREAASELFESGQFYAAATRFVEVLLRCPTCTKSSFNLAVILQTLAHSFGHVDPIYRSVYYLEEPEQVVAGYRSVIAANSESHVRAVHSLATLEGATTTMTAAPEYVAEVFDELAESFEEKLVAHLEYRVPWQLVEALQKLAPPGFVPADSTSAAEWVVADVGCGTGLCGRLLRPHVKRIIGVDISPLMIEKTRAAGSYDELQSANRQFVVAGKLCSTADHWFVFALSAQKLRAATGWLAFSIELLPPAANAASSSSSLPTAAVLDMEEDAKETAASFRLAPSGRFQHSHEYIASLAERSGFSIAIQQDIAVRKESGEPIAGRIYLLQRKQ
ncbi:hypothetical protein BBJ28_00008160 [Nothophytophthora sp. Chile5]|nr:hypothetical protein BBJ28_00008160 [Nothophytophthora sp. Chile5]